MSEQPPIADHDAVEATHEKYQDTDPNAPYYDGPDVPDELDPALCCHGCGAFQSRANIARAGYVKQPDGEPLAREVERGVTCFHGTERACLTIRCGSNCWARFDRMHPCPACLIATIHDLREHVRVLGGDPWGSYNGRTVTPPTTPILPGEGRA